MKCTANCHGIEQLFHCPISVDIQTARIMLSRASFCNTSSSERIFGTACKSPWFVERLCECNR